MSPRVRRRQFIFASHSPPPSEEAAQYSAGAPIAPYALPRYVSAKLARCIMAKAVTIKVKLVSSADTGFYYVTKKNSRTMTDKLTKKKYDPVAKKHVEFRESRIK
jgi:large subunit ribosomal protein L33